MAINDEESIALVRKRTSMYTGNTSFFGFIHYVVSAYDLLLQHKASWIETNISGDIDSGICFRLSSDAKVPIKLSAQDLLIPFEEFGGTKSVYAIDGVIVNALSSHFQLKVNDGVTNTKLVAEKGIRKCLEQETSSTHSPSIEMEFKADSDIFSVTAVSPAVLHSYCKRMSYLHTNTVFRIKAGNESTEYRSKNGIRDLFEGLIAPYQILHQPIYFKTKENDLSLELIFAFHSWYDDQIITFANNGRVPMGGTHLDGLLEAFAPLREKEYVATPSGVLAILSIDYPDLTLKGCIKEKVGNPELQKLVRDLVINETKRWLNDHQQEVKHLSKIERFNFPPIW